MEEGGLGKTNLGISGGKEWKRVKRNTDIGLRTKLGFNDDGLLGPVGGRGGKKKKTKHRKH
jgi:hypothetical protein